MLIGLCLLAFFGGSLKYLFIFIRSLQLIVHLPIFMTVFPANALVVIKTLFPIASYDLDLFGIDWTFFIKPKIMEESLINDQMLTIGYQTNNSIHNLGTISALVFLYILQVILMLFIWSVYKAKRKGFSILSKIRNRVLFSDLNLIAVEGFLQICIAGYL